MSRLQLALNVADLNAAVDFYSRLFDTPPHKQRPGYANFAIADPPLKLVLFESADSTTNQHGTSLNHLGVEFDDTAQVEAVGRRWQEAGLQTRDSMAELCCHAVQDKVWATDPNGGEWEAYTIIDDEPTTGVVGGIDDEPSATSAPTSQGLPLVGSLAIDADGACGVDGCA